MISDLSKQITVYIIMAQIQEYHQQIESTLKKLTHSINHSPLFSSDKKKWKQECNKLMQNCQDYIRACEELISEMPASSVRHYVATTKNYKKELQECKQQFQAKSRDQAVNQNLNSGTIYDNRQVLQTIQRGDDAQDRINDALLSMEGTVEQGISLADSINLELNKQIQQLDRIHGKMKDTESSLKRAQKSIMYFMRALECDKCMLGLILLIVLALIALIVLVAKK